jgi:hypothetical protein
VADLDRSSPQQKVAELVYTETASGKPECLSRPERTISCNSTESREDSHLNITRIRDPLHSLQERPTHRTLGGALDIGVRTGLIIPTAREYRNYLLLSYILIKPAICQSATLLLPHILKAAKEACSTCVQVLRFAHIETASLNKIVSFIE